MQLDRRRFCWTLLSGAAGLLEGPAMPANVQMADNIIFVVECGIVSRSQARAEPAVGVSFLAQNEFSEFWKAERHSQKQHAVVGLTSQGILACMELLARDTGRRTLFRAEHKQVDEDSLITILEGPATFVEAMQLDGHGPLWSTKIQEHIAGHGSSTRLVRRTTKTRTKLSSPGNSLFSWVIGPCSPFAGTSAAAPGEVV
jgi:hypothetical protein